MTLVIAWRTTKLIEGGHRDLQAYRPICYFTSTFFYVFYVFFENPKKVTFYVFLPCFIRFLELWLTTDGRTGKMRNAAYRLRRLHNNVKDIIAGDDNVSWSTSQLRHQSLSTARRANYTGWSRTRARCLKYLRSWRSVDWRIVWYSR